MSLSSYEVVNKQFAQLFKRTHRIRGYFAEPNSCWALEGSRECSAHYFVGNPLEMHSGLKGSNVIKRVTCSIVRIQRRQLKL